MPPGKGRYTVGGKGTHGCSGYPVVGGEGKVHGCHRTLASARAQQAAIYASEGDSSKALEILELIKQDEENCDCYGEPECECDDMETDSNDSMDKASPCWEGYVQRGMKPGKDGQMVPNCVPVEKAEYNTRQRREMAARGQAMPDGSFPIANRADLQNAIQSVGRAANYEAAKRHIMRRARALNAMDMLPEEWTGAKKMWSGNLDPRNARNKTF